MKPHCVWFVPAREQQQTASMLAGKELGGSASLACSKFQAPSVFFNFKTFFFLNNKLVVLFLMMFT